jgi:drug efflux transport system permease protein
MQRVGFLIWKELIELRGDPRLFGVVVLAPIIQLFLLGYAATTDVRNVPVVVADADRSAVSRDLVERFNASPNFSVIAVVSGYNEIDPYLERGLAWMALSIPPSYGESLGAGRPQTLQVIADGSDANSSNVALGYATNLIAAYAQELSVKRAGSMLGAGSMLSAGSMPARGIDARVRVWFNPRLESHDFMIPGVLALLLLVVTTNLSSMGIVREKELGTLEQLNVTPLRRWQLIVGKLLPYALIGMIDAFLVIAVAVLWFQIPLRGSLLLLLALTLIYLLTTLGLGLFVSTVSSTQQQAMMTTTFFFLTPMIYLSGFVFPIDNMPPVIQFVTYLIPLRYFLVIVRSIFLKGVGLETLWPQVAALTAWGVAILSLAIARSTKRSA